MTEREPRSPKAAPRLGLSALEWRLYLVAALAAVYTATWLALAADVEPPQAVAPPEAPPTSIAQTTTVRARPVTPRASPTPARVATRRSVRIRTRSS